MNDTIEKLKSKKMHSCSFEIVNDIPIYLDYGAKNISPLTSDLCRYFVHSAWVILDKKNHIHFIMEEMPSQKQRNYEAIDKIISKFLSQK